MIIEIPAAAPPAALDVLSEVLFCSYLQPSAHPDPELVRTAVQEELQHHVEGPAACAATLAQRYGDDPLISAERMRWCRDQIAVAYTLPPG